MAPHIRFGTELLQNLHPDTKDPMRFLYERCELLDELGFDFGTLGHHRFSAGYPSAPFTLLGAVAARTSRLRIGPGILVLPSYHPLDVAEQVATLDRISNGRAFLGAGVGYRSYEYDAVQVPFGSRGSRMSECLEVLRRAWTEYDVTFEGRHFQFSGITVQPRPVQAPHPPIWVGALFRPAIERAARLGDAWYGGTLEALPLLRPTIDYYRDLATEAGRTPVVCLKRPFAVASTRDEVERAWLPGYLKFYRHYVQAGGKWNEDPAFTERVMAGDAITLEELARDRAIAGTPDDCIAAIKRAHDETGCDYIALQIDGQADNPEAISDQLKLFAEEVMPAFTA